MARALPGRARGEGHARSGHRLPRAGRARPGRLCRGAAAGAAGDAGGVAGPPPRRSRRRGLHRARDASANGYRRALRDRLQPGARRARARRGAAGAPDDVRARAPRRWRCARRAPARCADKRRCSPAPRRGRRPHAARPRSSPRPDAAVAWAVLLVRRRAPVERPAVVERVVSNRARRAAGRGGRRSRRPRSDTGSMAARRPAPARSSIAAEGRLPSRARRCARRRSGAAACPGTRAAGAPPRPWRR